MDCQLFLQQYMSLLRNSKELQFRVCNHDESLASPVVIRKRGLIFRGKGSGGGKLF